MREIVDRDAAREVSAINAWAIDFNAKAKRTWTNSGGELINLPGDEQAAMMKTLASVGADVSKSNPKLADAYQVVTGAAQRAR